MELLVILLKNIIGSFKLKLKPPMSFTILADLKFASIEL